MATQMQKIEKHFDEFLLSKHKIKMVTLSPNRARWGIEYEYDFIDEWETTGWILYKPFFKASARLYMFKGKPYQPTTFKHIKWYQNIRRFQYWLIDRENQPDWSMRNKVERHIAQGWIKLALIMMLVAGIVMIPSLMDKLKGDQKEVQVIEETQMTEDVQQEKEINQEEKATQE